MMFERRNANPSTMIKHPCEQTVWVVRCHSFDDLEQDRPNFGLYFPSILAGGVKWTHTLAHLYMNTLHH
ncbi:hypothetical protein PILCRDRAFT_814188 [Piloderma croceum F 1598]|uniref:Uncharacterized protein n=1 Tax=Piloderma croceum (strain F 1598) TaxID=765440 RepID=A0A0C3GCB0_PILCF|nr:hypothetical protein PILCRDRAFT_814188 [Piloderma croceum F 1598]